MRLPPVFFHDEVRCGFRIPTAIKQVWAAQLTILAEIDRICRKHDIMYFAEWGSLLGAVRHRGFIPWDDDLDIGMKREDYRRFRDVADAELPEGYCIHDYDRQDDHWLFLSRVVNRAHITFDPAELDRWYNYPWLAGVDIFVLDYRYRDHGKEERRRKEVLTTIARADGEEDVSLRRSLYREAEELMAQTPAEESDRLVQMFPWGLKGAEGLPKDYYAQTVYVPFEQTEIPVPAAYEKILRNRYGPSWTQICKGWGGHGYPAFEGQKERFEQAAGLKLPAFHWEPDMPGREPGRKTGGEEVPGASKRAFPREGSAPGNRKHRIVFLPVGPAEWQGMRSVYEEAAADPENEAVVVPLPRLWKTPLGEVTAGDEELLAADRLAEYPQELPLIRWFDYDPGSEHPDRIVFQDPYDGTNPCLTIPAVFYASQLKECTDDLVYIPAFETDEFGENDRNDCYNMKHYVTAPGVVYADRVIVQSENTRQQYIRALTLFAGEDTRQVWERKIRVKGG